MERLGRFLGAFFGAFLCVVLFMGIYGIAEDITLTTYYPAPYGAYNELTTTGNTYLATDSGNVGIGTTSASAKLAVVNPNAARGTLEFFNNDYARQDMRYDGGSDSLFTFWNYGDVSGGTWFRSTSADPIFYMKNSGEVGIKTDNPQATLDVNGTIAVSGTPGVSGTFTTADTVPKTVTVTNGIITNITP